MRPKFCQRWIFPVVVYLGIAWLSALNLASQARTEEMTSPAKPQDARVDLSGYWSGHWESCTTGHQGPLQARFCKIDDDSYCVRFSGRFFRVIPFHYSVTLNVTERQPDKVILEGDSRLGALMGTFHYRAEASATAFIADYRSRRDNGRFVLNPCCP